MTQPLLTSEEALQLIAEAEKRAEALTSAKHEMDLLYEASNKLVRSSTPAELLDAISDYPRQTGAINGTLAYYADWYPKWLEVVATWGAKPLNETPIGIQFDATQRVMPNEMIKNPHHPVFVDDVFTSDIAGEDTHRVARERESRSLAVLPLYFDEKWIGVATFAWKEPRTFDERDERIFTALHQQLSSIVASKRLFHETQARAVALESANHEMDLLYEASNKLVRASTPAELLEAVSAYPREIGAVNATMGYFDNWQPQWLEVVAVWATAPLHSAKLGARVDLSQRTLPMKSISKPERPLLVGDLFSADFVGEDSRELARSRNLQAMALLPLHFNGRWVGTLTFGFTDIRVFTDRDERIFTALHQQLSSFAAFKRLLQETQTRATELEIARNEMNFLYEASNKLIQASTPSELLDAVSEYPRGTGAVNGILSYFDNWHPQWLKVVACWGTEPIHKMPLEHRFDVTERIMAKRLIANPHELVFVEDLLASNNVGEDMQETAQRLQTRAIAILPLYYNEQWIGILSFAWKEARSFDERDRRIFTALHQQLSAFAATKRLLYETQVHARELEIARREMDFLYRSSHNLVQASDPNEILEAVSEYARSHGASRGLLVYIDFEDNQRINEVVAEWTVGNHKPIEIGTRFRVSTENSNTSYLTLSHTPVLIADVLEDDRISPHEKEIDREYSIHASALLPLYNNERRVANLLFCWDKSREFDERDERIYTVLQQQVAAVVDSDQLFEGLQKRATELEMTNNELNLLYKTSESINSANTYQEVVEAVAQFDPEADVVTLMLWDTWDWKTAEYLEVPVVIDRHNKGKLTAGSRLPKKAFPIAKVMMGQRVWLIEDGETDPRIDPITAESWKMLGIRSFMGPALYVRKRWLGGITFHSSKPRKYSQREERLLAGVGDLVLAAIIRIRLQNETEASRKYAETLAHTNADLLRQAQQRTNELEVANAELDLMHRIGEGINAANTYAELVQAVSKTIEGATAVALFFWEGRNYQTASYVEQVAATSYLIPFVGQRVSKEILTYTAQNPSDRLMVFEDVTNDSRLTDETISHYLARELQAAISIRLYVKNRWIGALVFNSNVPYEFSEKDKRLAAGVGNYVMGAVERIRLHDESETARREAERHALQAQKLASLEERTRLARELHDSVSQVLYGIGLGARTARTLAKQDPSMLQEPLDYILSLAEAGLTEMRALIFELRPESLEQEGLITTLKKQALSLSARYGIHVDTDFCREPQLPLEEKESLYRIAREALHNTVKHAQATSVRIALLDIEPGYRLEIEDNGLGFDTDQTFAGHLGLKSMRERTTALDGELEITSKVGTGTTIAVNILTRTNE